VCLALDLGFVFYVALDLDLGFVLSDQWSVRCAGLYSTAGAVDGVMALITDVEIRADDMGNRRVWGREREAPIDSALCVAA
jgi:hypothetical protein